MKKFNVWLVGCFLVGLLVFPVAFNCLNSQKAHAQEAGTICHTINLTLTSANTEYAWNMPSGTSEVHIQSRASQDFKLSNIAGTSGTTYFTVKSGTLYWISTFASYNCSFYFQSVNAGQVLEITYITGS